MLRCLSFTVCAGFSGGSAFLCSLAKKAIRTRLRPSAISPRTEVVLESLVREELQQREEGRVLFAVRELVIGHEDGLRARRGYGLYLLYVWKLEQLGKDEDAWGGGGVLDQLCGSRAPQRLGHEQERLELGGEV